MTYSDLRIGNYVKLRDTGEVVRVCGLTKSKCGFHAPNERPNAHLRYRRYSEIEGVLIFDHWQKIESGIVEWYDRFKDGKYYRYLPLRTPLLMRYIHELQNIHHALTGEELKIEL